MVKWKQKIVFVCMTILISLGWIQVEALPIITLEGLTREQAAVKIIEELGYRGVAKRYEAATPFGDVTTNRGSIYVIQQLGIMSGVGEGNFDPKGTISKETARILNERIQGRLDKKEQWTHAFYAIQSSAQMELIDKLDAVSFGWAQVGYDEVTQRATVQTAVAQNDYKVPKGFEIPLDYAKARGVETYLMLFYEDQKGQAYTMLSNAKTRELLVADIVSKCVNFTEGGVRRSFDGVTIDFENFIHPNLAQPFNAFLKELDKALEAVGKKLNVAVQPNRNFKGYDYRSIGEVADQVILMAHDYEPRKLTQLEKEMGTTYTPITPIYEVFKDLTACIDPVTGVQDKTKVVLQISFGSAQWQTKDGKVIHDAPYRPSYDKILARLNQPDVQLTYDTFVGNTYATYIENGIHNTIWFEDSKSVEIKTRLIKLLGLGGVSYWRLGTIPNFILK